MKINIAKLYNDFKKKELPSKRGGDKKCIETPCYVEIPSKTANLPNVTRKLYETYGSKTIHEPGGVITYAPYTICKQQSKRLGSSSTYWLSFENNCKDQNFQKKGKKEFMTNLKKLPLMPAPTSAKVVLYNRPNIQRRSDVPENPPPQADFYLDIMTSSDADLGNEFKDLKKQIELDPKGRRRYWEHKNNFKDMMPDPIFPIGSPFSPQFFEPN